MRALFALAVCSTLSACNVSPNNATPEAEQHSHENADAPTKGGPSPKVVPDVADDARGSGQNDEDVATDNQGALIPASFHGVWDYEGSTCAPESDLRLDVQPSAITFYETHGDVLRVDNGEPMAVSLDLAMSGEGEEWDQSLALRLVDAGTRLMVINPANPDAAEDLIRMKCPS
ncbi:MAG: hypothetical protein AAF251_04850 [Pseudomonadota bacterium]